MVIARLTLVVLIAGCTMQSEFYSPQVKRSERLSVGVCGHTFELFRREITPGIILEMWPTTAYFRLDKEKSVRLAETTLTITHLSTDTKSEVEIIGVVTGKFPDENYANFYGVPEEGFAPLEEFRGAGRYEDIEIRWGQWSPWIGKHDIFTLQYASHPKLHQENIIVNFPPFFADGILTKVEPVEFRWEKKRSLMCVQ